jgi:hypothetical protein
MTDPGSRPGTPDAGWAPTQDAPAPAAPAAPTEKKGLKKVLPYVGSIAAAGILGAGALTGGFGFGDPAVGDCVQMQGETSFDVVDCAGDEAEYKIVGIHGEELTWPEFEAAASVDEVCQDFATWEVALWIGDLETEPGAIYCSESV